MKFLVFYRPDAPSESASQDPARGEAMAAYAEKMTRAGVLLSQAMFDPAIAQVSRRAGEVTIDDGHQPVTGYAFLEAPSHRDAIELTKEFLRVAGDGVCEVRGVLDGPPRSS
jgi:hypothetical protein